MYEFHLKDAYFLICIWEERQVLAVTLSWAVNGRDIAWRCSSWVAEINLALRIFIYNNLVWTIILTRRIWRILQVLYSLYLVQIAIFRQYYLLVYFLHAYFQVNQHVDKLETFDLLTFLIKLLGRFLELHGHPANVSALVEVRVPGGEVIGEAVDVPV